MAQVMGIIITPETTPLKPISLYAKEKVEVEKMLCDHSNFIVID